MGDRGAPDPEGVVDLIRAGDARTIARAITRAESADPGVESALRLLHRHTGRAHVVGVTGPPGSGKSTLVDKLVKAYRERGLTVGVVAVEAVHDELVAVVVAEGEIVWIPGVRRGSAATVRSGRPRVCFACERLND